MRMPISLRRRETLYAITPYNPIIASSSATPPKNPDSMASNRSRVRESSICVANRVNDTLTRGLTSASIALTLGVMPAMPPVTRSSAVMVVSRDESCAIAK